MKAKNANSEKPKRATGPAPERVIIAEDELQNPGERRYDGAASKLKRAIDTKALPHRQEHRGLPNNPYTSHVANFQSLKGGVQGGITFRLRQSPSGACVQRCKIGHKSLNLPPPHAWNGVFHVRVTKTSTDAPETV